MYDAAYFFVPNSLNRYTLSQRNKFITNADGSVILVPSGRLAGQSERSELAARAKSEVHSYDAAVLAERDNTVNYQRDMETARDQRSEVAESKLDRGGRKPSRLPFVRNRRYHPKDRQPVSKDGWQ